MKKILVVVIMLFVLCGSAYAQGARFRNFSNASPKAGEAAPDFKGINEEGKEIALSQFKDKKHVVFIFGAIT